MNTSPWNKDRIIGQKRPLQISHIWGIRIRLELEGKTRDLALFNMALDSKLRGCDLVKLKVSDVAYGSSVRRTKPYLIYKKTKNLRVIQLLLGHKKLDSTVRYLGIEVDDALEISESIEV
ncbi:TPA: integrase [Klebsiella pneumoniae]|nr:integrase [Klebsiella pneumoniae]EKZ6552071.1 integrase [Klebsiella pneumoniae]HEJ0287450.1 integrase [Klebsiella pneumoniae]